MIQYVIAWFRNLFAPADPNAPECNFDCGHCPVNLGKDWCSEYTANLYKHNNL